MIVESVTVTQVAPNNRGVTQSLTPINGGTAPSPVGRLYPMGTDTLTYKYVVQTNSVYEHHKNHFFDPELS